MADGKRPIAGLGRRRRVPRGQAAGAGRTRRLGRALPRVRPAVLQGAERRGAAVGGSGDRVRLVRILSMGQCIGVSWGCFRQGAWLSPDVERDRRDRGPAEHFHGISRRGRHAEVRRAFRLVQYPFISVRDFPIQIYFQK